MKIEHLAIWVRDLEGMRKFYQRYFSAKAGKKYVNLNKNFQSYFLEFEEGCRLELMYKPEIPGSPYDPGEELTGLTHFAISVGSEATVDELTERLREDGFRIVGEPRRTGDGYYESIVLDPEGNRVEMTA